MHDTFRTNGGHARRAGTKAIAGLLLTFLVAGCISAGLTVISTFASTEGHFSVTVPDGSMSESTLVNGPPFDASPAHVFVHTEPSGLRFSVIYGDADPAYVASHGIDEMLDHFEASNVTATKGTQTSERHLVISGLPGREQRIDGPAGAYVFRTVMSGDRLYSFSLRGTSGQVQEADAQVFLDSFALVP